MENNNQYRFRPYTSPKWDWLIYGLIMTALVYAFANLFDWYPPLWVVAPLCVGWCGFRAWRYQQVWVSVSDEGICIAKGKQKNAERWEHFTCAYLMDITWVNEGRYSHQRYQATYLLLARGRLDRERLEELSFLLQDSRPCGEFQGHFAVRTHDRDNEMIRRCIGTKIPILEERFDPDEEKTIRL